MRSLQIGDANDMMPNSPDQAHKLNVSGGCLAAHLITVNKENDNIAS